jgi:hypothetical protein
MLRARGSTRRRARGAVVRRLDSVARARTRGAHAVAICIARGRALHHWLALALLIPHAAHAQLTAAEVVGAAPHDAELVARVSGQTRDLPLHLRWAELALDAHPSSAQLSTAAREQHAEFVVAIRGNASAGQTVYVYDAKHDALRTRRMAPSKRDRMSRSAAAETVALIVRGELNALLADREAEAAREHVDSPAAVSGSSGVVKGSGGDTTSSIAPASTAANTVATRTPRALPKRPTPARSEARHIGSEPEVPDEPSTSQLTAANPFAGMFEGPLTLALAAGMRAGLPIAEHVLWSPNLALQLRLLHLGFELHGNTSFTAHLASDSVRIALRRHAFGAAIFASWRIGNDIDVALGPALDLALLQRTTVATGEGLMKTADRSATTVTVAALADLRWRIVPRVGVSVRIGLDFPLHPLLFAYGADRELARQRSYEPWALASVFVDIWE